MSSYRSSPRRGPDNKPPQSAQCELRKILTASRKLKGDQIETPKKEVSKKRNKRDRRGHSEEVARDLVKSSPSSSSKLSKSKKHAERLKSSSSVLTSNKHKSSLKSVPKNLQKDILNELIPPALPFSKSFKIPKKVSKPRDEKKIESCIPSPSITSPRSSSSSSISGHEVTFDRLSAGSSLSMLNGNQTKPSFTAWPEPVTHNDSFQDCEEMEWETTVEQIKGLWSAAHFLNNKSGDISIPAAASIEPPDVDMDVDVASNPETSRLVIVPDTNIWIHCLSLIRALLDSKFEKYSLPTIVIPWMVLQELDVHGKQKRGPSRGAIHFIHRMLTTKHPQVKGQKASDAVAPDPSFDRMNADDSILQCALQCQKETSVVVLLTNDRNLENKAMVMGVLTANSSSGVMGVKDAVKQSLSKTIHNFSFSLPPTTPSMSFKAEVVPAVQNGRDSAFGNQLKSPQWTPEKIVNNNDNNNNGPSPLVRKPSKRCHSPPKSFEAKKPNAPIQDMSGMNFQEILQLIQETLSYTIETKMKDDYGDPGWLSALKIPPPWTLKSAVNCLIKHWMAVFSEVFGRKVSLAEKLLKLISDYESQSSSAAVTKERQEGIVECVLGLFAAGEFAMSDLVRKDTKVANCRQTLLQYQRTNSA